MSVIAPPEVERPYDHGWEPYAERVTRYRTWTRTKQASLTAVFGTGLVLGTAICVIGGQPPWEPSAAEFAVLTVALLIGAVLLEVFWEGRGLSERVAGAEPMPDGALEIGFPVLRALVDPSFLLRGVLLGVLFGAAALILGDETSRVVISVLGGMAAGRLLGLELLLRRVVERADPSRTFFIGLEEADDPDAPLLWRSAL